MARWTPNRAPSLQPDTPRLRTVAVAWIAGMIALLAVVPDQFADPFAAYDDFPILFDWWPLYFEKTLSEGRWFNYAWQYLVGPLDRHLAHFVVASAWVAICAILGAAVFREDSAPWRTTLVTVAMTLAPPFAALMPWPNVLVPIMLVVLAYAVVAAWAPARVAVASFPVFAVLGVMSYTTSPIIMALALVLARDWRGWRRAIGVVVLMGAGVGLGVLVTYALNWHVHGVFGLELASWRQEKVGLIRSVERAQDQPLALSDTEIAVIVLLLMVPLLAFAASRARSLAVLAVLGCGVGFLVLIKLVSGAHTPMRGIAFAWLVHAALLALVARDAELRTVRGLALGALAASVALGGIYWRHVADLAAPVHGLTTAIAEALPAGASADAPILVYGGPHKLTATNSVGTEDLDRDWSLAFRLYMLTGRQSCICNRTLHEFELVGYCPEVETRAACAASAEAAAALIPGDAMPAIGTGAAGAVLIRFPD